jgi:pimeloyl-ACP methyl ester carboxylesterase
VRQPDCVVPGCAVPAAAGNAHSGARARRAFAGLMAGALVAGLAACGGGGDAGSSLGSLVPPQSLAASGTTPETTVPTSAAPAPTTAPNGASTAGPPPITAPPLSAFTGDPFFDPGDAAPGAPGEIIRSRPITTTLQDTNVWQVLHWSRTAEEQPVAVSATVVAPTAPSGSPRPVFAYAHGTTGLGDQCALSAQIADGTAVELSVLPVLVSQGLTVVIPDYQGLGTPGDHPYLVGQSEGRNLLDGIRAAGNLQGTGSTPESKAVVWGHSQGGGAAAFTAELQPTYAPEVPLVGAIAGAPPADLATSSLGAINPSYRGFVPMIVAGLRAGYPALAADDGMLGAEAQQALTEVSDTCVGEALAAFNGRDVAALFADLPVDDPSWRDALAANRAGDRATDVPIFIYHGADDDLVPPTMSASLFDRYCAGGVNASRTVYPGTDHVSVLTAAFGDIAAFTLDRLSGKPAVSGCN